MCVLMTDVPSRGVSAVLTGVQSWPRATRGLSSCGGGGNRGDRGAWTVSRPRVSHKAARGGYARPDGTVRYFSCLPFTTVDPRPDPCRRPASRDPTPRQTSGRGVRAPRSPPNMVAGTETDIRGPPAPPPARRVARAAEPRARVATITIGDAYVDDRGHL